MADAPPLLTRARLRLSLAIAALASIGATAAALLLIAPPDPARAQDRSPEVLDVHGVMLRPFAALDGRWRLATRSDDVSPLYLRMLLAYEDKNFDRHAGIDPLALSRASWQWVRHGRPISGASTISMQTVRLLQPGDHGLLYKLRQIAKALALERSYTKQQILDLYLTLAPFGGNLEGVRAAAWTYFGKEPLHLTAAEAALLVALPQAPAVAGPTGIRKRQGGPAIECFGACSMSEFSRLRQSKQRSASRFPPRVGACPQLLRIWRNKCFRRHAAAVRP